MSAQAGPREAPIYNNPADILSDSFTVQYIFYSNIILLRVVIFVRARAHTREAATSPEYISYVNLLFSSSWPQRNFRVTPS